MTSPPETDAVQTLGGVEKVILQVKHPLAKGLHLERLIVQICEQTYYYN